MARKRSTITEKEGISKEGKAMDEALKKATRRAVKEVFRLRDVILVERDGWLVYVNASGEIQRKLRRITPVKRPA